jgi:hypothetical protein
MSARLNENKLWSVHDLADFLGAPVPTGPGADDAPWLRPPVQGAVRRAGGRLRASPTRGAN